MQAVFIRLAKPLPFDAVDGKPVDLLFALAVPEHCTSDHLKLLSEIAEKFSDQELLQATARNIRCQRTGPTAVRDPALMFRQ